MAELKTIQDKVQRMLAKNFPVELLPDGGWMIRHGSTGVMVDCYETGNEGHRFIVVDLRATVLRDVPITPDLTLEIATSAFRFGSLWLIPEEGGSTGRLWLHTSLLGDFIDEEEVICAVQSVVLTADDMDDEWMARFGGSLQSDAWR